MEPVQRIIIPVNLDEQFPVKESEIDEWTKRERQKVAKALRRRKPSYYFSDLSFSLYTGVGANPTLYLCAKETHRKIWNYSITDYSS